MEESTVTDAPPTQAPQAEPTRVPPPATRPGHVTAAGVIHIVAGVLTLLFGLIFVVFGAVLAPAIGEFAPEAEALAGAVTGILLVVAVLVLAIGALFLVTGIKVLGGRPWARIVGIVLAVLGLVFSLGGLGAQDANVVLNLIFAVAWAYTAWALFAHGPWFEAQRPGLA
jgi:hypothetical protein